MLKETNKNKMSEITSSVAGLSPDIENLDLDNVTKSVFKKFIIRHSLGKAKYGTTLDRTDLEVIDWINHAQEEHMDAILYLEKLKQELTKKK